MNDDSTFRIAEVKRTWDEGKDAETHYWLELKPDLWTETNRPCESREEAVEMLEQSGYGERQTKTLHMLAHTRYLRMTSDRDTFKVIGSV